MAIRDNGIGGADLNQGSGLLGLRDRIEALGGTLHVTSPAGNGTTLLIQLPLEDQNSAVSPSARGGSPSTGQQSGARLSRRASPRQRLR
jgi:signal transduction histidine kinase